jgi:hypothetical protein
MADASIPSAVTAVVKLGSVGGERYLFVEDVDAMPRAAVQRFLGWYYGYPRCCAEAFVADTLACRAPCRLRPLHPDSGHVLCEGCAAGPSAPLRRRVADRYGFASLSGGGVRIVHIAPYGVEESPGA